MSIFSSLLPGLVTSLSTLSPFQLAQLAGGVTQATQSTEMSLIQQIEDNPASGASALATLSGQNGIPPAAVSWASAAIKSYNNADKTGFASDLAQARAVILAQHINVFAGLV
jgi:hypothetical protein